MTGNETEATSWEASVARTMITTPGASSPYPNPPSTLEELEPDMDNDIISHSDTRTLPHTSE